MITFKRILSTARLFSSLEVAFKNVRNPNTIISKLTHTNAYNFAFMSLFENNKKPAELDPAFKKPKKLKGHIKHKKNSGVVSTKLNPKIKQHKQILKNHKGLLKRIKIVN